MPEESEKRDKDLEITIETPKGPWKNATFPKTAKISEVINAVIDHFGFSKEGRYQLVLKNEPNKPLDPNRTLVSFGIKDGDVFVFVDLGVAV